MRVKYKNTIITVDRCEYTYNKVDEQMIYHVKLMNNSRVIYFEFDVVSNQFWTLLTNGWIDLDKCSRDVKSNPIIMGEEKCYENMCIR